MVEIGTTIHSPQTGESITFLSTAESSNGELFRAEAVAQPGPYVVAPHIHPRQEERFIILEGLYGWQIGRERGVSGPGSTLVCPPRTPHSHRNAGSVPMRFLYEHRPALVGAEIFFETLFGLSRDGKLRPSGDLPFLQGALLLAEEAGDFLRPASPPMWVQNLVLGPLAKIARSRGYKARYPEYLLPQARRG